MIEVQHVFVVDDDQSVRRSLRRLLESKGFEVITFDSAEDFLSTFDDSPTGCIILDVDLPGLDGPGLQEKLAERDFACPIVFLTGKGDIPTSVKTMKLGAEDFLTKPFETESLIDAIRRACSRQTEQRALREESRAIAQRVARLTRREHEVFKLVIAGLLNKEVAAELGIRESTVKVHRGRVMAKMEVESFAELVRIAEKLPD